MPKITINEWDLTRAGVNQFETNAVYIPGYAVMGPINEPTLCETLDEFKAIFGEKPYRFKRQQTFAGSVSHTSTDYVFEADDYERSYIYAYETLYRGLPVIYTRIFNVGEANANLVKFTAKKVVQENTLTLKAKQPGEYGKNIYYKVTDNGAAAESKNHTYTIEVGRNEDLNLGVPAVSAERLTFAFDPTLINANVKYYNTLESKIVDFEWAESIATNASLPATTTTTNPQLALDGVGASEDEFTVSDFYAAIKTDLENLKSKGTYPSLKFVTTGAYPSFEAQESYQNQGKTEYRDLGVDQTLINVASSRGDCIALIDHIPDSKRELTGTGSVIKAVEAKTYTKPEYGAMFTPAGIYANQITQNVIMVASFGYIIAYAVSVQSNPTWLAAAGAQRGKVSNLVKELAKGKLTDAVIDDYQARNSKASINPITEIKPYGELVWGNRTLKNNQAEGGLTAQSFLNIRSLLCDLKKVIYTTCKGLTFEQNSDILWINFKAGIVPLLDQMVNGNGLRDYEIKRRKSDVKGQLKATIKLYAIEAVEDFDITIELSDAEVTTVE